MQLIIKQETMNSNVSYQKLLLSEMREVAQILGIPETNDYLKLMSAISKRYPL
jgi:hypothetical protein